MKQRLSLNICLIFFKNLHEVLLIRLHHHSIIYLFGRVQPRYFIYSDFILIIFIFITFVLFFKKKEKKIILIRIY